MSDSGSDDAALMLRVSQGDAAAYHLLVDRYSGLALSLARKLCPYGNEAEDLVQDAFTTLWIKPHLFDPGKAAFKTWFCRILVNRGVDIRRRRRAVPLPDDFDVIDPSLAQDEHVTADQQRTQLHALLATLPDRQRTALILVYLEDMKQDQAAAIMGLSLKALESLLTRARQSLRKKLAGQAKDFL